MLFLDGVMQLMPVTFILLLISNPPTFNLLLIRNLPDQKARCQISCVMMSCVLYVCQPALFSSSLPAHQRLVTRNVCNAHPPLAVVLKP